MHPIAQRLLSHIRQHELLKAGERVGVAVSGGIDSVALLRLLLELRSELGIVLSVVHFNHKLRGAESDRDEQFVAELARQHDLEFLVDGDDVAGHAREDGVSLETAARELRYGFFRSLIDEGPQGLKPHTSKATLRGPEGPLFHGGSSGSVERRTPSKPSGSEIPTSRGSGETWGTPLHSHLNKIVTGHTLDDQAETVLMRLIRGAGLRGLGGIYPRIPVEDDDGDLCGEIVRPLLATRRRDLEQYLKEIGQPWREDATNDDAKFTRNRIRKLVVPLLEKEFNPSVAENLAELAEIARGEEDYWENELAGWMGTGVHWSEPEWARKTNAFVQIGLKSNAHEYPEGLKAETQGVGVRGADYGADPARDNPRDLQSRIDSAPWLVMNASVDRLWFLGEPIAVQRRVVKAIGDHAGIPLGYKHVEQTLVFAAQEHESGKQLSLPLGWKVLKEPHELIFRTPDLREPAASIDYEYDLLLPGQVEVFEAGSRFEARRIPAGTEAYNPEQLLDAESLPGPLKIRNWRAGDRFWPAHTKSPKKIKELLQEHHVVQPDRKLWPVIVSGDEIVWVRGFPLSAQRRARPQREAVLIRETRLRPEDRAEFQARPRDAENEADKLGANSE